MDSFQASFVLHQESIRRLLMLLGFFLIPVSQAVDPGIIADPDIWWHLRTGQWIVEHRMVPRTDMFSSSNSGDTWVAYSWLFEVIIYNLYRVFGLSGAIVYTAALWVMIAGALIILLRRLGMSFAIAVALAAAGLLAAGQQATPRPWLFSILLFIVELNLVWTARRSGDAGRLWLLAPLFALWANLHIQFIYGLFVIGLAAAEASISSLTAQPFSGRERLISYKRLWLIFIACVLATLINPYHLKIYWVIYEYMSQAAPFRHITELQSPGFRDPASWALLIVTLGAVFALAWRREAQPFPVLLLLFGAFLSFRARRDMWLLAVIGVANIAAGLSATTEARRFILRKTGVLVVMVGLAVMLMFAFRIKSISEESLKSLVAENFPADAADVVEQRGYGGPLYNDFDWGGYLIWRLPSLPVSIDGRTNLYGDARLERFFQTWGGKRDWMLDPDLAAANLIIANINQPLCSLLRFDKRFELVYEDAVAAVFIARIQPGASARR